MVAKKGARSLEYAAQEYKEVFGKYPRELKALVGAKIVRELPAYPGGEYLIDPDTGKVDWIQKSGPQWP